MIRVDSRDGEGKMKSYLFINNVQGFRNNITKEVAAKWGKKWIILSCKKKGSDIYAELEKAEYVFLRGIPEFINSLFSAGRPPSLQVPVSGVAGMRKTFHPGITCTPAGSFPLTSEWMPPSPQEKKINKKKTETPAVRR